MAKLTEITSPTVEPLGVSDLRTHLRIDDGDDDAYLDALITVARKTLEQAHWTQFCTATWDQYFDAFGDPMTLRRPPVGTVASVKYTDTDGDEQTVAATVWEQGLINNVGVVRLAYNQTWPSGVRDHPDSVVVRFTAGYGGAAAVPEDVRHAMKLFCGHLYENRERIITGTTVAKVPFAVEHLMQPSSFAEPVA